MSLMLKIKEYFNTFILAVCAGMCIGVGGTVYLMCTSKLLGAGLFSVGLLTILIFKLKLFTGMTGYIFGEQHKLKYILTLLITWVGNFVGTFLVGCLLRNSRIALTLIPAAQQVVAPKLEDSWYSLMILGVFCGLLMYIGVDSFKKSQNQFSTLSTLMPVICVSTFILAGFEHCIADMFYCVAAGLSLKSLIVLLFVTFGNIIGSFIIPIIGACVRVRS
jgi:formate/nitrite transporter FocA (FNT family)